MRDNIRKTKTINKFCFEYELNFDRLFKVINLYNDSNFNPP